MKLKESVMPAVIAAVASIIVAFVSTGALTNELKSDVARLEAIPVGTIVASMLNETQFNKTSEGLWVLADGRNVANTTYSDITGKTLAPDLRGYFLRGLDESGARDPDGKSRNVGSTQDDAVQIHAHDERSLTLKGGYWQHSASPQGQLGHANVNDPASFEYSPSKGPRSIDESGAVRSATETRPANVSVYFYIKVNATKN
jgi:hypothetical protein